MDHRLDVAERFAGGAQYIGGRPRPGTSGREHAAVAPAIGTEPLRHETAAPAGAAAAVIGPNAPRNHPPRTRGPRAPGAARRPGPEQRPRPATS